ncbi:MAG TPA: hypothetical protein PLY32_05025 [Salinivirgaceae bacterium]|nr:hypothetical protein [Salinivirgaceae bacterium]HQA76464.1 hypothetical protein [Salinivirgaceae bacterium]
MKNIIFIAIILLFAFGCEETNYPFIFPEKYFPAYPESYWVYSNGTTEKVDPGYHKHIYYKELGNMAQSEFVFVPRINNEYVFKYNITQNNTLMPIKTLLKTTPGAAWVVNHWEGKEVYRKVVETSASITLSQGVGTSGQTVFDSVIVVVEYIGQENENSWVYRESYAPNVGLIKREINNSDSIPEPYTEMELRRYFINKK